MTRGMNRMMRNIKYDFFHKSPNNNAANLFNHLERGNYSATSNNMKLVHWPLMGGMLHLVQRGGDWAGLQPT